MLNYQLSEKTKIFPSKPGIYQFLNSENTVIYIGKAKDLRKRVKSYFSGTGRLSQKTRTLLKNANDINYVVVDSESEALLLENTLIKKYKPKYNILLKDDKTYPWITIRNEPFPRIYLTRKYLNNGSKYFGPFSSVFLARTMLDQIKKIYPLRTCNFILSDKNIFAGKFKPCLEYHLGNCLAPCIGNQTLADYNENIKAISSILKGQINEVIIWLKENMQKAALSLDFEKANALKLKIELLEKYKSKTVITGVKSPDLDVFNYYIKNNIFIFNFIRVVNGSIVQTYTQEIKNFFDDDTDEVLSSLIVETRKRVQSTSKNIVIPINVSFKIDGLKYFIPQKGEKKKILDLSLKNCIVYYQELTKKATGEAVLSQQLLEATKKELKLKETPFHIECFDNSNLQGSYPSSSCIVFRNAQPAKKEYRHFNVKTVIGPNDFATMQEVVYRRYKRMIFEGKSLPQLIIIDGGRGQLSAAFSALKELKVEKEIILCGLAKRNEEIFFHQMKNPIILDKKSQTLRLMQHIRDEAHRFGLKHHRNKRSINFTKSQLEQIKGIGKKTIQKLFLHYKSIDKISKDKIDNIAKLVGKDKALKISHFIKSKSD